LKQFAVFTLKVVILAAIVFFLTKKVDISEIGRFIKKGRFDFIALAGLFIILKYCILGYRWYFNLKYFLHIKDISLRFYIQSYLEVVFLRMVFPIPDSEDMLRILKMKSANIALNKATQVIIIDRTFALLFILALLPFTIYIYFNEIFSKNKEALMLLIGLLIVFVLVLAFRRKLIAIVVHLLEKLQPRRFIAVLKNILLEISSLKTDRNTSIKYLMLIGLSNLLNILALWILLIAYAQSVSIASLYFSLPLLLLPIFLPISYQGLGVFEAILIGLLPIYGVSNEISIVVSSLHFSFEILMLLLGGCIYTLNRKSNEIATIKKLIDELRFNDLTS
jgi:uncharacterized protein (TIRG00374 family)